ncbi:MAG: macro domain-containing protein [Proteobacteria bacterium]|nr:macro domain-containing protein [Pseudomonadota bacterium]
MTEIKQGDILQENAEALVNAVNCVGVMGKGVALQFRNAFPDNYRAYAKACKNNEVQLGRMFLFKTNALINPHYIINFPTKLDWRHQSLMQYIENGLQSLVQEVKVRGFVLLHCQLRLWPRRFKLGGSAPQNRRSVH